MSGRRCRLWRVEEAFGVYVRRLPQAMKETNRAMPALVLWSVKHEEWHQKRFCPWVYFIQGVGGGPIKIGHAEKIGRRLDGLQAASPVTLRVLAGIRAHHEFERRLHECFAEYRLHGEWFRENGDLYDLVQLAKNPDFEWVVRELTLKYHGLDVMSLRRLPLAA